MTGASTDPEVHKLIADRRAYEMVLADETSTRASQVAAEQGIRDIDAQLRQKGFGRAEAGPVETATDAPGEKRTATRG